MNRGLRLSAKGSRRKYPSSRKLKQREISSVLASGFSDEWLAEQWTELITRVRRRRREISRERTRYSSRKGGFFPCSRTTPRCRTGNTRRSPSSMAPHPSLRDSYRPPRYADSTVPERDFVPAARNPLFVQRQPPSAAVHAKVSDKLHKREKGRRLTRVVCDAREAVWRVTS